MSNTFITPELLTTRTYVSLSSLETSLSSSVTSSATSLLDGRLKISNLLNQDVIFPINWKNLSESIYFGSAYVRTKASLNNIVNNYPIGLSGSTTSNLYLEHIENANNFIATLGEYDWWVFRQLCGEELTTDSMTYTATATAVRESLSSTISSASQTYVIPVINRDADNNLKPPQGIGNKVTLDNYYADLLEQTPNESLNGTYDLLTPFEQILTTAIAFDQGVQFVVHQDWSGTGSEKFSFTTYDGILESRYVPEVITQRINRSTEFLTSTPQILRQNDQENILERVLESFAQMFDDVKLYIDGLKNLFKNYWGYYDRIPKGYVQQLVAHQYGIELFSSENKIISDTLEVRGQYKSQKEITFEFWNRIMCSLVYILKTKGAIESIRATSRAYGFNSNLMQIYELVSYNNALDGYYNTVRNHSTGIFKRSDLYGNSYFQSISASLTSTTLTAFTVHVKTKFTQDNINATASGVTGALLSLSPSASVTYQYITDTQNVSTSGFPFLSFTFTVGNASLTTGYSFITNANRQSVDGYFDLFFTKENNNLYITNGYELSNYDYYNPVVTTVSSTFASLTSLTTYSPTAFTVGSTNTLNIPEANISNIYLQRVGYDLHHFKSIILDSGYLGTPSSYSGNVIAWQMNEYSDLQTAGQNYIIDSSINNIHGFPTIINNGISKPYDYIFDDASFINDGIPGFKNQRLDSLTGLTNMLNEQGLRVGISLAEPINTFIHSTYGSNIGELYANPLDVYSQSSSGKLINTYSLVESKSNDLFSILHSSRNQIQIAEFLKFLNKISGHLAGFFHFIEQIVPASKELIEKGIIVENPINNRIILHKTTITKNSKNSVEDTIDVGEAMVGERPVNLSDTIDASFTSMLENVILNDIIDETAILTASNITEDAHRNTSINTFSYSSYISSVISQIDDSIDGSLTGSGDIDSALTGSMTVTNNLNTNGIPTKIFEYIPRNVLTDVTKTTYYSSTTQQLNNRVMFNNISTLTPVLPSDIEGNNYFINIVLDDAKILLSTALTASNADKKISGVISIIDTFGRTVQTDANAIRIDFSNCTINGLNRFRFIYDGKDVPFNVQKIDIPIVNKQGIHFEIDVKSAPNDGVNSNQECFLFFDNLMNPNPNGENTQGRSLQLFLADTMENFSGKVGYSIQRS